MSALTPARELAANWARHGSIDVRATDADGHPLPLFLAGGTIAKCEVEYIRSGDAPPDLLLAIALSLPTVKDQALLVGFYRELQTLLAEVRQ